MRTQAEWKVETHINLARLPIKSITRPRISAAALLVKVMARIDPGCTLRGRTKKQLGRETTGVLPDPAPATTSTGLPSCSTASRCGGFNPSSSRSVVNPPLGRAGLASVVLVIAQTPLVACHDTHRALRLSKSTPL